ncbi:Fic family protein [Bifidobacterium sp. ESL0745]|uniref:Fic/DOC family protein n=1 Tax=Bifidobacterium sp. ESL0745 TaxID=2983226 RepID=UPI0023F9EC3A|nr:Fic family protein [Bifidobacterium sp. ESL0745]MDF7665192.1 Fic family protein [Bifidobacterium sp. ESL0745]
MPECGRFVDPYLIAGTDVLKNLVGAKTQKDLLHAESMLVTYSSAILRSKQLHAEGTISQLCSIHRSLFFEVYPWAGEFRTVDISKGGSTFLPVAFLATGSHHVESVLQKDAMLKGMDRKTFIQRLSVNYDNLNNLHPFREGNGRAQRIFWELVAHDAGWHFDWGLVTKSFNDQASIAAMHDDDLSLLKRMFDTIVKPLDEPLVAGPDLQALSHGEYVPSQTSGIRIDETQSAKLYQLYIDKERKEK